VTVLDAYALIAFLLDEPAARDVERLIRRGPTVIPVVNFAEALDVTQRVHGVPAADLRTVVQPLLGTAVRVIPHGESNAWRAAEIRLRYYDRRANPLSLADCLLLASVEPPDELATADPGIAAVARAEGTRLLPLPDSAGSFP
jgi:predicted nucleic acid-binding protein